MERIRISIASRSFSVSWVPREANFSVDELARQSLSSTSEFENKVFVIILSFWGDRLLAQFCGFLCLRCKASSFLNKIVINKKISHFIRQSMNSQLFHQSCGFFVLMDWWTMHK